MFLDPTASPGNDNRPENWKLCCFIPSLLHIQPDFTFDYMLLSSWLSWWSSAQAES
jgi:hypothetical protein